MQKRKIIVSQAKVHRFSKCTYNFISFKTNKYQNQFLSLVLDKRFLYNNLFLFRMKNPTENGPGHIIGIFLSNVFSPKISIEYTKNKTKIQLGDIY